ncbi:WecB/TagA/CpsF family glycosyltransferase [Butyricimonas hominis]|uniref:WecB/TagA/CpsF family glycosyltransferase n=1 Tax=Butyricimonas TaxID=574697 RepID=UPI0035159974
MKSDAIYVNGIKVYPFTSEEELLESVNRQKGILIAINAEKIMNASEEIRTIISQNIGYCDGVGTVIALKKKGYNKVIKIAGCELWLRIIKEYYKEGKTFYLIGGKQEVIERTVAKLKKEFLGIQIVNYRNGYIKTKEERQVLIQDVIDKRPDVVFVAMGSPKQELLMQEMLKRHLAIYQGLGGSFDVYTGLVKRAPKFFQKLGLEWFYRLLCQPKRIARQWVYVKFMFYCYMNKL